MDKGVHLVFYDGDCALCHTAVLHLMRLDKEKLLLFAPLEGETAREILVGSNAHYARADTIVLVESFRSDAREFWVRSQAIFRVYWLLGRGWIGWLSFLPGWVCDWAYRSVAKHRHRLHFGWERPEFKNDRFLP
jgi:predicted DCC family thiol-disulfide oxidoreductase YuxK